MIFLAQPGGGFLLPKCPKTMVTFINKDLFVERVSTLLVGF